MSDIADTPDLTIGIPTINRLDYLKECFLSCVNQKWPDNKKIEIIISNNSSNDGTEEFLNNIVKSYAGGTVSVKVLHQSTVIPMIENWNACLTESKGSYFLLLSDDDVLCEGFSDGLFRDDVTSHKNIAGILTGFDVIDGAGCEIRTSKNKSGLYSGREFYKKLVVRELRYVFCGFIFKTDILKGGQVFEREFEKGMMADGAAIMNSAVNGDILVLEEKLVQYRVHDNNNSKYPDIKLNIRTREFFIDYSKTLENKWADVCDWTVYWCLDGYFYQAGHWVLKKKITSVEIRTLISDMNEKLMSHEMKSISLYRRLMLKSKKMIMLASSFLIK